MKTVQRIPGWRDEQREPSAGQVHEEASRVVTPPSDEIRQATATLVAAALAWADRDYGDLGEFEADAALNDAVREYKRLAERSETSPPLDYLFERVVG